MTEIWHNFDHFMRIMMNQANYKQRPFARNLAFNFMRCFFDEFLFYMVYETLPERKILVLRSLGIIVMTYLVQKYVNKKNLKKNVDEWAYLQMFFLTSFGIQFIYNFSKVEADFKSHLPRTCTFMIGLMICYLFGDVVEDFFYNDLDRKWGDIWHNWNTFGAPILTIVFGFALAHFYIHADNPKGALRHESGVKFSLQHSNLPLIWPATHFKKHEDENWLIVLLANSAWAFSTLYYTLLWKSAIRVTKPKKVSEEQLAEQYEKVPGLS